MPETRDLAHFALLEPLGGGEARVWRVRDGRDGRELALKVFELAGLPDAAVEAAIADAARQHELAAAAAHAGILAVEAPVRDGDRLALPMPLAAGDARSLRGAPPVRVLRLLRELTASLVSLHAAGVAHRDLKPGNVLLDGSGRALLADFGCAAAAIEQHVARLARGLRLRGALRRGRRGHRPFAAFGRSRATRRRAGVGRGRPVRFRRVGP